ncbi:peptidyl-prolyl cis-trans isomerase FKBP62-like [Spinacia oleracea]|uniref:Peptidyl-prolyl cis-trans isomerase FKBP62-like n=1 Tax=Spinacia oleracea TaxID=3562 RepID=A0A9R0IRA3_SPIOL|nr:peptidyl-prolyl cis-trans isomerase FKBP62-like [Spinacia oleracea]
MCSLVDYKKFRGELNRLLLEGDNLKEEDELLFSLISESENPKEVLDLTKEWKEEGNMLFKSGNTEDALEKYGYACLFLTTFLFQLEEDIIKFFELAICILLNLAACFNKKKEFDQVGYICTIILEFDPTNIKALFRRATAAIELGRSDFAYWDLAITHELDPSNREVGKKLEQVQQSTYKRGHISRTESAIPVGLGLGLPSLKIKQEDNVALVSMETKDSAQQDIPSEEGKLVKGCPDDKVCLSKVASVARDEEMEDNMCC